jgi:hypothetical protein
MSANSVNYKLVLADLENRIQKLQTAAEAIREILTITEGSSMPSSTTSLPLNSNRNSDTVTDAAATETYNGLSIADAAKKYLRKVRHPLSAKSITDGLEESGYKHASGDFVNTVRSALHRELKKEHTELIRRHSGSFALAEWYPETREDNRENEAPETIDE